MNNRQRQLGASLFGFLYIAVTLGLLAMFAVYSVPIYMTSYSVAGALQGAAQDPELRDARARQIQESVGKRLRTSYVDSVKADQLVIKKVPEGRKLEIKYTVDQPFLFNIGIRYHFDKSAVLHQTDG